MSFPLAYTSNPDGPPPSQRPKIDTFADKPYHLPSHVAHSLPSSGRTSSFKRFSSSDYDQPSYGLPPPKHPRLVTAPSSPLTTHQIDTFTDMPYHSPSHVTYSLPSSGRTSSFKRFSSSDYDQPSYGLPPPKHPRLVTAPSSLLTTLHGPTSTVVLHTAGPHRDPGYESTSTAASPSVAPPPPPATTASPCLQHYVKYLKDLYISRKTPVYDKESSLLYYKAKEFINIALVHKNVKTMAKNDKQEMLMDRLHGHVDDIQKKKTPINFTDVCKCDNGEADHCVLVEGAPGVGKTTFAFELCKQWARGEILQEWGVVVIIKLRDQRTRAAQTINDLLIHPDLEIRNQVAKELVEQNGKGMLLILDGYDELTTKQRESGSVIQLLMSRELLCRATLMVTSRPLATRTLHPNFQQSIDQHIEVLGFTDKNIEEFINSACGDNPELVEDFKDYLSCHPFSSSLMFNPLQCAIVTDLYRSHWQCGDKGFAPKTLTELYTGLVHTLLLRYLTHHPVHKDRDWSINTMNDLPDDVKQQLKAVTALAAKGIEKQQYVFDEDVPSETLGLMQQEEELTAGIGRSSSHNFLHLTLQEYLAAVHYSQQCDNDEQQLSHILGRKGLFPLNNFLKYYGKKREKSSSSSATHWPAVLFLAGKTHLSGIDPNLLKAGLRNSQDDSSSDSSVDVSLLHLLYETQCPQLIQSTLVTSGNYISVSGRSALDWFVIGYCIANSTSTWRIEKKANDVLNYFDNLVMGLELAPQNDSGGGRIVSLDLSGSWSGNCKILSMLQPFTKSVTDIKLAGPKQGTKLNPMSSNRMTKLVEVLDPYCLKDLWLENSEANFPYCQIISQQNNLHILSLRRCNLSIETSTSLIFSLQSPHCKLLKISLDDCTISSADCSYQFSIFTLQSTDCNMSLTATGSCSAINHWLSLLSSYSFQLTELILSITKQETDETLEGIGLFSHMLEILNINNTTFFAFSIPLFFELRQNNLHTLSLTKCELSSEATSSLIHSLLSPDYKLNKLSLCECTISTTDHVYQHLSFTLQHTNGKVCLNATGSCSEINYWLLQLSSYTKIKLTESILEIEEQDSSSDDTLENISLYHDVLEILRINVQTIKNVVIPQFIGQQQNNLHSLSLKGCNLSSESTSSLIHSLQSPHCRLLKLALYGCTIPTTDHTLLTTAIVSSTTITQLLFIDKHIDTPSLTALVSGLKQNRTMEELAIDQIGLTACFTKEQFQLLIEGVECSAVKKLWLQNGYEGLLSYCPLSRGDIVIEWYKYDYSVYEKWYYKNNSTSTEPVSDESDDVDFNEAMDSLRVMVSMEVTNIGVHGYPGIGKTSILDLAMGKPPALERNSTDCVDPPSRYVLIKNEDATELQWENVTTNKLFEMVCGAIKTTIKKNSSDNAHQAQIDYDQAAIVTSTTDAISQPLSSSEHVIDVVDNQIPLSPAHLSSQSNAEPNLISVDHSGRSSIPADSTVVGQTDHSSIDTFSLFSQLLEELRSNRSSISGEMFDSHWMMVTDCGGQPPFLDAAALFLQNSCLQIFPVKLNEPLSKLPEFLYFFDGKSANCNKFSIHLSNQMVLETLAKAVSSFQPPFARSDSESESLTGTTRCKFTIIGTFADEAHICSETLEEKESILREVLEPYESFRVQLGNKVILPINAITTDTETKKDRTETAKKLRQLFLASDVTMKVDVRLCWFGFLLRLLTIAEEENKAVLALSECYHIGGSLGMNERETKRAIQFFHDIRILMYYDTPNLRDSVIIDTKAVFNKVSRLLALSFLDEDYLGRFSLSTLERCVNFSEPILTPQFFLCILEHVKIVAAIDGTSEYFMPCALAPDPTMPHLHPDSWIIRLRLRQGIEQVFLPIPVGYLPAIVVFLLTNEKFEKLFDIKAHDRQYRNNIMLRYKPGGTVCLIERHLQLEILYRCTLERLSKEQANIRNYILDSIRLTEEKLHIRKDFITKVDCFPCFCSEGNDHHVCTYNDMSKIVECEKDAEQVRDLEPRHLKWLGEHIHYYTVGTVGFCCHVQCNLN